MEITLSILSGARAGEKLVFAQPTVRVGRHAEVDLRFDPTNDLAVSTHHAVLFFQNGSWFVRDLGSRNGTRVNDHPVSDAHRLQDGDRITFGHAGPAVKVTVEPPAAETVVIPAADRGPSTLDRMRIELGRRTRRYRTALVVLLVATVAVVATLLVSGDREREAWDQERLAMEVELDSIRISRDLAVLSLEQQLGDLTASLTVSEERIADLSAAIAAAETAGADPVEVEDLRRELQEASDGLRNQRAAAALDFAAIQQRNRHAVARIYVETGDGEIVTATAFAVRPDATLITSRHVLNDADGRVRPRRIAIQFADSRQIWPARLLALSEADLAIVKVDNILGDVPTVQGLNLRPDTIAPGAPVAMLGFPGVAPPQAEAGEDEGAGPARPLLSAGIIRDTNDSQVQVRGYGSVGASGSPIFDSKGEVVGVVFGGRAEADGHLVFGIPAPAATRLIESLP